MRRWVLLLALLLLSAACLADSSDPTVSAEAPESPMTGTASPGEAAATVPSTPSAPEDVAAPVTEALAFIADTVDGGPFDGGAYARQDLMLWFWAPW